LQHRGITDDERRLLTEYLRERGSDPDALAALPAKDE
jgi:hypothetical protein